MTQLEPGRASSRGAPVVVPLLMAGGSRWAPSILVTARRSTVRLFFLQHVNGAAPTSCRSRRRPHPREPERRGTSSVPPCPSGQRSPCRRHQTCTANTGTGSSAATNLGVSKSSIAKTMGVIRAMRGTLPATPRAVRLPRSTRPSRPPSPRQSHPPRRAPRPPCRSLRAASLRPPGPCAPASPCSLPTPAAGPARAFGRSPLPANVDSPVHAPALFMAHLSDRPPACARHPFRPPPPSSPPCL